jgi:hypothetical protein
VDGRCLLGRALGALGETLRFESVWPKPGRVLLAFEEVEPLSLHEALEGCTDPADAEGLLHVAEISASRGLVDVALRDLDRALGVSGRVGVEVQRCRVRLIEDAANRGIRDAREHLAAGRVDHARAALDEVIGRFPGTEAASQAQNLRRTLPGKAG